ncbi:MAG: dTDP-4-dehydrorhamnose reductase [Pseudopedobacter saltans]|uniref:dTDP-4-dehydrorhamnose reductase n=1 Tax=Pseudopedobacter saltans TaxID=151895 RepID=A0A2W5ET27_9SPHI|nr:MAG: dTDP-4-dehydrorhamnose reductase [Pseudopedobacter saltans]
MSKPTIIVTGSNGQLGSELKDLAKNDSQHEWIFTTRENLNLSREEDIHALFEQYNPEWFINCAAYTLVDKAESEKEEALAANAQAPGIIARECAKNGTKLIHVSTDYVFHGDGTAPYKPEDPTNPVNFYGETKLQGENNALKSNPETIVIRTSWVYSSYGKNFVKTMRNLMASRSDLNVVADQKGTPTYAKDLARAIVAIVASPKQSWGIYHFSNAGEITWFDFAKAIQEISGLDCEVHPIPTTDFPTPAKRPAYSVLDKSKIVENYGIDLQDWKNSLIDCIHILKENEKN